MGRWSIWNFGQVSSGNIQVTAALYPNDPGATEPLKIVSGEVSPEDLITALGDHLKENAEIGERMRETTLRAKARILGREDLEPMIHHEITVLRGNGDLITGRIVDIRHAIMVLKGEAGQMIDVPYNDIRLLANNEHVSQ